MCARRCVPWLKDLPHTWHLYGFSPVWTLMWHVRPSACLNALPHTRHLCGLSPLCIVLCAASVPESANRRRQTVHSNGFSPEWTRLCFAKSWLLWQHFPHSVHLYLPLWIFICLTKHARTRKRFPHRVHGNGHLFRRSFKRFFPVNNLTHTSIPLVFHCKYNSVLYPLQDVLPVYEYWKGHVTLNMLLLEVIMCKPVLMVV